MEFLQLSETNRAREIDAELKKNKWRNEWLDPTRAWVAPGSLSIFFCFSVKPKFFTPTHEILNEDLLGKGFHCLTRQKDHR